MCLSFSIKHVYFSIVLVGSGTVREIESGWMQVVSEEEWSEANWKQGHTYTTHKEAFRVINIFAKENCTISLILLGISGF